MVEEKINYKVKDIALAEWGRKEIKIGGGRDARTHVDS